ncbi:MAG: BMP family ABC transporter substrate-binding protein [Spirochaetales bacterium]
MLFARLLFLLAVLAVPLGALPATLAVFIPGALQGSPTYELLDAGVRKAAAEVAGTKVKTIEGGFNQAQWGEQLATLAASGDYQLIVTSNPAMPEICLPIAEAYPKQRFLILESWSTNPSFATLSYNHRELAYLHGALAGLLVQARKGTPTVGLIAGQEYPDMNNAIVPGFREGFQSVLAGGKVEFRVVGNWYDAQKGAELAKGLFDQGVSVVLPIAGGANQGVVSAAKQAGKSVLWYDNDGYSVEKGTVVGSGVIHQDTAAYQMVKKALAGTLAYGKPVVVGFKEGYLDYVTAAPAYVAAVPASVRATFEALVVQFRTGKKTLPALLTQN